MSIDWDKFKGKDLSEAGTYLGDGLYKLEITRCVSVEKRDTKVNLFFAEFDVKESNNPAHPVGSKRSWCQNLDVDAAEGSMMRFLLAANGVDPKTEEGKQIIEGLKESLGTELREALDDPKDPKCKNALKGKAIACEVRTEDKKKKEGKFSKHYFSVAA